MLKHYLKTRFLFLKDTRLRPRIFIIFLGIQLVLIISFFGTLLFRKLNWLNHIIFINQLFWIFMFVASLITFRELKSYVTKPPSLPFLRKYLPRLVLIGIFLWGGAVASIGTSFEVEPTPWRAILISPVWEEFARLRLITTAPFYLLQSISFAISHDRILLPELLTLTVWGIIFTAITVLTKNVWNAVICHSVANALQVRLWSGLPYVNLIMLGVGCVLSYFFIKSLLKFSKQAKAREDKQGV